MAKVTYTLDAVNSRLKAKGSKTRVERRGKAALNLCATLPPKPRSKRVKPFQQRIPLRLDYPDLPKNEITPAIARTRATILKRAEAEAEHLNHALTYNTFSWDNYEVKGTVQATPIAQLVSEFKTHYFNHHKLYERTWANNWQRYFNYLPQSEYLTPTILRNTVAEASKPNTQTRAFFCKRYEAIAAFAGVEVDLSDFKVVTETKEDRSIPSDETLIKHRPEAIGRYRTSRLGWQWVYSILYVAGLRPHEAFFCEWSDEGLEVLTGKTGERTILYEVMELMSPGLIQKWDLKTIRYPGIDFKAAYENGSLGRRITRQFWKWNSPVVAYDLRHAFALRGIRYEIPTRVMAQMMGHSEKTHVDKYRKWLDKDRSKDILRQLISKQSG